MRVAGVHILKDLQVAFIAETHNGCAGVANNDLLERQDSLDIPQGVFASEHTLEGFKGVLFEHSDNGWHAGRIGQHAQPFKPLEQIHIRISARQETGHERHAGPFRHLE